MLGGGGGKFELTRFVNFMGNNWEEYSCNLLVA